MASDIRITDHALVRFLERVEGIDLDPLREEIVALTREAINAGASGITINGFLYNVDPKSRAVVTIYTPEQRKSRNPTHVKRYMEKER